MEIQGFMMIYIHGGFSIVFLCLPDGIPWFSKARILVSSPTYLLVEFPFIAAPRIVINWTYLIFFGRA